MIQAQQDALFSRNQRAKFLFFFCFFFFLTGGEDSDLRNHEDERMVQVILKTRGSDVERKGPDRGNVRDS